jgi:hypothetical protein
MSIRNIKRVVLGLLLSLFIGPAHAEIPQEFGKFASTYFASAFSDTRREILKPVDASSRTFSSICISRSRREKCVLLRDRINRSFATNENLRLRPTQSLGDLQVFFADQNIVAFKKGELDKLYLGEFRDSSDKDCALYYKSKKAVVFDRVILVSLDASVAKQRMCLAVQFFQSLGLSFEGQRQFSKLWADGPDALSIVNDSEFERLVGGLKVITYIHMCEDIIPGMTKDEAAAALRTPRCWQGLYLKYLRKAAQNGNSVDAVQR